MGEEHVYRTQSLLANNTDEGYLVNADGKVLQGSVIRISTIDRDQLGVIQLIIYH